MVQRKKEETFTADQFAAIERELIGTQEMLAHVLKAVGEPVVVTKEAIAEGLGNTTQIQVDDDLKLDAFVFSLVEEE